METTRCVPIAQWIERSPPEAKTEVRLLLGTPSATSWPLVSGRGTLRRTLFGIFVLTTTTIIRKLTASF